MLIWILDQRELLLSLLAREKNEGFRLDKILTRKSPSGINENCRVGRLLLILVKKSNIKSFTTYLPMLFGCGSDSAIKRRQYPAP